MSFYSSISIAMNCGASDYSEAKPAWGLVLVSVAAWVPFVCLFMTLKMAIPDGESWLLVSTSPLYLHARWFFAPAIALFGPASLVGGALVQSIVVMIGLRLCVKGASRFGRAVIGLNARVWAKARECVARWRIQL